MSVRSVAALVGIAWVLGGCQEQRLELYGEALADVGVDAGFDPVTFESASMCSGSRHSCALIEGELWCWGDNRDGQLGVGDREVHEGPQRVEGEGWREVECGSTHTCAIGASEKVWCWGANDKGQIGRGKDEVALAPAQALLFEPVRALGSRMGHTCAVTESGELWCWGRNIESELGQGTNEFSGVLQLETPQRVDAFDTAVDTAVGDGYSCVLLAEGAIWCWGRNSEGQVGMGEVLPRQRTTPIEVAAPEGRVWSRLYTGVVHSCAYTDAEELYCWGQGENQRFGVEGEPTYAPIRVEHGFPVDAIASNIFAVCGLSGGAARCWGVNVDHVVGLETPIGESTGPGELPYEGIQALMPGRFHSCLIAEDGRARCVGNNSHGQLGVSAGELSISSTWVRPEAPWLEER